MVKKAVGRFPAKGKKPCRKNNSPNKKQGPNELMVKFTRKSWSANESHQRKLRFNE
jgi:hypothetical protein